MQHASSKSAAALERLSQIQEQMRDLCQPQYDEFYKVTAERGFVGITVPNNKGHKAKDQSDKTRAAA